MRILRNYIIHELAGPFLLSLLVFTFILIIGNLIKLADLVINKGVGIFYIIKFFAFLIPSFLSHTIPMGMLTATLLSFGRLSYDNELTAMRASGISMYSILKPTITLGLLVTLGCIVLNDTVVPYTRFASRELVKEVARKNPAAMLEEATFIKDFKNYVIYISKIDRNKLHNVRIYEPQPDKPTRTIFANRGLFSSIESGKIKLELFEGTSDEPNPRDPKSFYKLNFDSYSLTLDPIEGKGTQPLEKKPREMTLDELKAQLKKLNKDDIDALPVVLEMHKKAALSVAGFLFILIGLPLAIVTKRSESSIGFSLSLGIFICYYLALAGCEALALKGFLNPAIGEWIPNMILAFFGSFMMIKVVKS